MKKPLLSFLFILTFYECFTQYNPPISRSRFYNNKYSTFPIKPGDILLYSVSKDSQLFNLILTVKKFGSEINFDFNRPDKFSTGNINIEAKAVNEGIRYGSPFDSSVKSLPRGSMFWLSKKNYVELVEDLASTLDTGNGEEDFVRKNTSTIKINYKGREKIITVYNVVNKAGKFKKEMAVLTDERNPLIIKMDAGWTFTLKEVR